jgi:DNA-directed RNA polymerase subunit L
MPETQTIDGEHLKAILVEQARIALVNYDAAHSNHESIQKLTLIVAEQSRQVTVLIATIGDLLEALENSRIRF